MSKTTPAYGKIASVYDGILTISGFKRGIENFLNRLKWSAPPAPKILDAGCGTGLIALYLAKRFPDAQIYATDIDEEMLEAMERNLRDEKIDRNKLIIAQSDLRNPKLLKIIGAKEPTLLPEDFFDAVFVSGALEHIELKLALCELYKLLKPKGLFLNLGVRRNPTGAVLGMIYKFRPYKISEIHKALEDAGFQEIKVLKLLPKDFPANLSRIAIVAKKK